MKDLQHLIEIAERRTGRTFSIASDYAEPGYDSPKSGIVFGNWNPRCGFSAPKDVQRRDPIYKLTRILEHHGYELEWEDEWSTCSECGKAVRTQPDCYQWTSYFRVIDDCELICLDCLGRNKESYLESIEDNADVSCPPSWDPAAHGYVLYNMDKYETGFHPGQNDNPASVLADMRSRGLKHVVFRFDEKSQFYCKWSAYYKPAGNPVADPH